MPTVLISCSLLDHNFVANGYFIVKLKFTIVKITLNQYKVEEGFELGLGFKLGFLSHINITLYVYCLLFFTA